MTDQERTTLKEELKSEVREEIMAELRLEAKQPKKPSPWLPVQKEIESILNHRYSPKETGNKEYLWALEAFKGIVRTRYGLKNVRDANDEQAQKAMEMIPQYLKLIGVSGS